MAGKEKIETTYSLKTYQGILLPETYINYVKSKWMRSFRFGNDYMRLTDSDSFYDAYSTYVATILNQLDTKVTLALLTEDKDVALGFSVVGDEVLHYIYVGLDYRNQGIGTSLCPKYFKEFTHLTKIGLKLWPKKAPNAIFNPFQ
jgi:GNAT superfamily N-acetyltransferase